MQRIGIFGGSFNPIHAGHIHLALRAAEEHHLDFVYVVPAAQNPFRAAPGGDALRWVLVNYACATDKRLVPCDLELKRGGASYAIDTVRALMAQHPQAQFFFIVGEDSLPTLSKWKEADQLQRLVTFIPYPRTRESSTECRRRLSAGESSADLLLPAVADFWDAKGVVFDFGGVISISPRNENWALYRYCAQIGLSREALDRSWDKFRAKWDGGDCTFEELYALTFAEAGFPPPTPQQLKELWQVDACTWVQKLSTQTLELMRDLKALGKKIGILSNMSADFYERLFREKCAAYRALADVEVISGLVRMVKPARPIYDYTARMLNVPSADLLFLDDTAANVEAARSFGWRAQIYRA